MKMKKRLLSILLSLALVLGLMPGMSLTALADETKIGSATYTISDGALTVGSGEFTIENWASVFGTGGTSTSANSTAKSIKSVTFESGATLTSDTSQSMFYGWTALRSVDLTNLTASNVTHIGFMFMNCQKLTSVAFGSGFDTSKVNNMRQMFRGCSYLTALDLSTFKSYTGNGTRNLYQMFYNCSNLKTIRVSDDWNVENASGNETFSGCYALEGGNGTKANGSGDYTKAIIDGKDGQQGYFTSASDPVEHRHDFSYSASGSTLTATCSASDCTLTGSKVELTLTPPAKTVYGDSNSAAATLEGRDAFNEATGLNIGSSQYYVYYKKGSDNQLGAAPTTPGEYTVKVTISNVAGSSYTLTTDYIIAQKEIGLTWADTTFHYDGKSHVPTATATGLVGSDKCDVTVTGEQTAIGTYTATASGLSNEWYKLPENTTTEFAIEGWVGTARYTIEEAPSPKKLFAAKSISHEITNGVLTIYGGEFTNDDWKTAFANDDFITNTRDKITSVRFVKANEEDTAAKLTDSAQGMFQNWSKLESIDFTNLDTSDVTWMGTMFAECSSLTELDLSPLDTKKVTNMSNMFYKCSKLEKITVGANWQTASSTSYMFSGCNELAGNAGTTYKALFGNYINTGDGEEFLPDVNGTYAHVDKGTIDPGFFYNAHQHHLTYTVDQSKPWTITATCDADGCYLGDSSSHSVSISLVKPTLYVYWMDELNKKDGEYDKGASPLATLTMQNVGDQTLKDSTTVADPDGKINGVSISVSTFTDANTAAPTFQELTGATIGEIEYYEKGSDTKLDKAPTDAGTYTAKVKIGDATASVDYRIFKRFHSPVLISPKQNASFAFGETEQELITVEEGAIKKVDDTDTSTFEYALGTNADTIPTSGWSTDIPKGKGEGPFYVFYRVAGDKNHGNAMATEFPNKSGYANTTNPEHESNSYKPAFSVIVVSKTAPTPPVAKTLTYNSQDQELVEAGSATTGTMQYALGTDKTTAPTDNWDTAIPKGKEPAVYYVWYRVVNTNDTTSVINEPACVQVPLSKAEPTVTAPTATATYGQTLNDVSMTNPDGNPEGSWAWVDAKATSVGDVGTNSFKAKFTPTDADHYKAVEVDVPVTVANATLTNVSVTQNGTLTYTGEAQTPEVTAAATAVNNQSVTFTYSKTQDGEYGDMPTVTNVADGGTFYYKASAPNHNDETGSFTVTVNKATPGEVTAPTLNAAVTYDPGQTLASVTLPDGWAWVTDTTVPTAGNSGYYAALTVDDANYNYNGVEGYNADTHKVTRTVTLTVNKAEVTAPTLDSKTYNAQNQTATVPESTLYSVTTNNGGTGVGNYDVVLTLTDSTNYKWTDSAEAAKTLVFQITAASITDANVTLSDTSLVYSGSEQSVTVSSVKLGDTTLTADTDYEVTSGTTGTAKNTYTVTVTGKGNYKDTATAQWSIGLATPTIESIPTASAITYGQKLADSTLTGGAAKLGDTTVAGTFAWKNTETKPAVSDSDTTEYDVVFTPTDDDNYAAVECKVKLTVNKADPTNTVGQLSAIRGQKLADVALPTADNGAWSWVEDTTTTLENVGMATYHAKFTPNDTANYNTLENVEVEIQVAEKPSAVAATVTANNRTYDGSEKPLVNVDNSTLVGGEMQYALGTATEATQPYTTSIPTATDARTYYVWYKVIGNENHNDSEPACVTVKISNSGSSSGGNNDDAVQSVISKISALDPSASDYAAKAQEAVDAYNALADSQKNDDRFKDQTVAAKLADAQQAAADKKAVDEANALICNLPDNPKQAAEADAQAAYKAYMELSEAQKALLSDDAKKKAAVYGYYYEAQYAKAQKAKLISVKARKGKKAAAKWKAVSGVSGYQLYYKAKGTKAKKVTIKSAKTLKRTVKKLKAGKKYTFKVRTFTKIYDPAKDKNVRVYGKWSKAKKIRAKK